MTPTIRATVRAMFRQYSEALEGRTRNPYADIKGLVTVSVGCILEPFELALGLDWRIGDRTATVDEIRDDWRTVKALGRNNRTAASQATLTSIRLTDEAVDELLWKRLNANAEWLRERSMPGFAEFSADAQLAVLSAAWALGCDFRRTAPPRPALIEACNAGDWLAAKTHARLIEVGNPGVKDRNLHQELLFDNAQTVEDRKLDPAWLWWPNRCPRETTLREEGVKALRMIDDFHTRDTQPPQAPDTDPNDLTPESKA